MDEAIKKIVLQTLKEKLTMNRIVLHQVNADLQDEIQAFYHVELHLEKLELEKEIENIQKAILYLG